MAELKENFLSPLHQVETKDKLNGFRIQSKENLKLSESRRMELQTDLSTFQRDRHLHKALSLQWRWQQLKEREQRAHRYNRQLLQEFDRAQDTLRDLVARTAAMNTIRTEFERYLEESAPRWQQQLKEKTKSARDKRTKDYLKESLKMEEQEASHSLAYCSSSQGFTKQPHDTGIPKDYYSQRRRTQDYNQDAALRTIGPPWLTQTPCQLPWFPNTTLQYPQGSLSPIPTLHPPPAHHPPLDRLQPYPLRPTPTPHQWPPHRATKQADETHSWACGADGLSEGPRTPWSQQSTPEPPGRRLLSGRERDGGPSSGGERTGGGTQRRGGGRHLSLELDVKPVRLSSCHGESSDTERDSGEASRNPSIREKSTREDEQGREENEQSSSEGTSRTLSVTSAAEGSESSASSETGSSMKKLKGPLVEPQRKRRKVKESLGGKSGGCERESGTGRAPEASAGDKRGKQRFTNSSGGPREEGSIHGESSEDGGSVEVGSEQESVDAGEEAGEEDTTQTSDAREEEAAVDTDDDNDDDIVRDEGSSPTDGEDDYGKGEDSEEGRGSVRRKTPGETGGEGEDTSESEDQGEEEREGSEGEYEHHTSSQDEEDEEEETAGKGEAETKQEEGQMEEEEQLDVDAKAFETGEQAEESDPDDSIVLPREHRSTKKTKGIPEDDEVASDEDDDDEESECSGDHVRFFNSEDGDDDIEQLLAPLVETPQREEANAKYCDTPKVGVNRKGEDLESFCEKISKESKIPQDIDEEFDHFYD